jgi:uncharacterized protein (TIGR02594 family)
MRPQTHMETARRFIGLREIPGAAHEPFIQWCFTLCHMGTDTADEVPWCSAFANGVAYIHGLARSGSAAARSWLKVGYGVSVDEARPGDVVILKRGEGPQPGPEVLAAPGHVGFLVAFAPGGKIMLLGGNQGDKVSIAEFNADRILGIREIA